MLNVIKEMYGHETLTMILIRHKFSLFHKNIHNFLSWVSNAYEMKAQHLCLVLGHIIPYFLLVISFLDTSWQNVSQLDASQLYASWLYVSQFVNMPSNDGHLAIDTV